MKQLTLALLLVAPSVMAGDYWHPEAQAVVATAPDSITVCQWWKDATTVSAQGTWRCEIVDTYGARAPFELQLESIGPVRVQGKWAYAVDVDGNLVPMQESSE